MDNSTAWQVACLGAIASLFGALMGAGAALLGQWFQTVWNRKAEERLTRSRVESTVLKSCLLLPSNIQVAAGLITAFACERTEEGKMTEAHATKLAAAAATLVDPLPVFGAEASIVPVEYWPALKSIASASSAVASVTAYWSKEYLIANCEPAVGKLHLEELPKMLMRRHAEAMYCISRKSGLAAFRDLWTEDEVRGLWSSAITSSSGCEAVDVLYKLWEELKRDTP